MSDLNVAIDQALALGREAGDRAKLEKGGSVITAGSSHHPGDRLGRLVLSTYRKYDINGMKAIIRNYQEGYNQKATTHGIAYLEREQIHIGSALSDATEKEEAAILAAL